MTRLTFLSPFSRPRKFLPVAGLLVESSVILRFVPILSFHPTLSSYIYRINTLLAVQHNHSLIRSISRLDFATKVSASNSTTRRWLSPSTVHSFSRLSHSSNINRTRHGLALPIVSCSLARHHLAYLAYLARFRKTHDDNLQLHYVITKIQATLLFCSLSFGRPIRSRSHTNGPTSGTLVTSTTGKLHGARNSTTNSNTTNDFANHCKRERFDLISGDDRHGRFFIIAGFLLSALSPSIRFHSFSFPCKKVAT